MVLYAFAKADQKKQVQVTASIDTAFRALGLFPECCEAPSSGAAADSGAEKAEIPMNIVMGEDVLSPAEVKSDLERLHRELEQTLSNQVATHTVSIHMGRDGLVISLREAGFFASGSATPKPATLATLKQIAASLSRDTVRPARRGSHRQHSHSHRRVRFQLGTFNRTRYAHRTDFS